MKKYFSALAAKILNSEPLIWIWAGAAAAVPAAAKAAQFNPSPKCYTAGQFLVLYIPNQINYVIHEAGHMITCPVSGAGFLCSAAGTMLQLGVPLALFIWLIYRGERLFSLLMLLWLGYSMINTAYYVADAPTLALPLYNPADFLPMQPSIAAKSHDWRIILGMLGLVEKGPLLGKAIYFAAFWCMCTSGFVFALKLLSSFFPPEQETGII